MGESPKYSVKLKATEAKLSAPTVGYYVKNDFQLSTDSQVCSPPGFCPFTLKQLWDSKKQTDTGAPTHITVSSWGSHRHLSLRDAAIGKVIKWIQMRHLGSASNDGKKSEKCRNFKP